MAQHLVSPPTMLTNFYKFMAEFATPEAHIPWRWELKNHVLRKLGLQIGQCVAIDNGFEWLARAGGLILHDYAVIGKNVRIYNFSDVIIGRFCMFAGDILIANGGHDKDSFEPFSGPIKIGNGCWIGTGAKIVGADLTIGDNAIIGAGALVNKDVPPCAIVAGVPAKIIGYRTLPDKVWHLGNTWFSPYTFKAVD